MSHAALGPQSPSPRPRLSSAECFGCALRQGDAFAQAFDLFDDLADSPHVRLFAHRPNLGGLRCVVFGQQGPHVAGVACVETDRAVFVDVGDVAADDVLDPVFRDEEEERRILGDARVAVVDFAVFGCVAVEAVVQSQWFSFQTPGSSRGSSRRAWEPYPVQSPMCTRPWVTRLRSVSLLANLSSPSRMGLTS